MGLYQNTIDSVRKTASRLQREDIGAKAWIADVGKALGFPLPEFKRWLLKAHFAGDLSLAGCDLVPAHSRETVEASCAVHDGEEYHFIRVTP